VSTGTRIDSIAVYYLSLLSDIREAARKCGYAIAIHGSLSRDFDLIAAPWTDEASDMATLVEAVRSSVDGTLADDHRNPGVKPHGRIAYTILLHEWTGGAFIDLSVMPKGKP